jgi:hypothetical protein
MSTMILARSSPPQAKQSPPGQRRKKGGAASLTFKQTLEADRARELKEQMLAAGLPV